MRHGTRSGKWLLKNLSPNCEVHTEMEIQTIGVEKTQNIYNRRMRIVSGKAELTAPPPGDEIQD